MKIENVKLSKKELEIAKIQSFLRSHGYQWTEHVFNDVPGNGESYIQISKNTHYSVFDENKEDGGWGRFPRIIAWRKVFEFVDQISKI